MSTIEKLLLDIFEKKKRIVEQVKQQTKLFDQYLASKCLLEGIPPPHWLFPSSSSTTIGLNKDDFISGVLLPKSVPTFPYTSSQNSFYENPVVGGDYTKLPDDLYVGNHARNMFSNMPSCSGVDAGYVSDSLCEPSLSVTSPQECGNQISPDHQTLARLQRSKSRQKALELRESAKAAKSRSGCRIDLAACASRFAGSRTDFLQSEDNDGPELVKPAKICYEISAVVENNLGDCHSKEKSGFCYSDKSPRPSSAQPPSSLIVPTKLDNLSSVTKEVGIQTDSISKTTLQPDDVKECKVNLSVDNNESDGGRKAKTSTNQGKEKERSGYSGRFARSRGSESSAVAQQKLDDCHRKDNGGSSYSDRITRPNSAQPPCSAIAPSKLGDLSCVNNELCMQTDFVCKTTQQPNNVIECKVNLSVDNGRSEGARKGKTITNKRKEKERSRSSNEPLNNVNVSGKLDTSPGNVKNGASAPGKSSDRLPLQAQILSWTANGEETDFQSPEGHRPSPVMTLPCQVEFDLAAHSRVPEKFNSSEQKAAQSTAQVTCSIKSGNSDQMVNLSRFSAKSPSADFTQWPDEKLTQCKNDVDLMRVNVQLESENTVDPCICVSTKEEMTCIPEGKLVPVNCMPSGSRVEGSQSTASVKSPLARSADNLELAVTRESLLIPANVLPFTERIDNVDLERYVAVVAATDGESDGSVKACSVTSEFKMQRSGCKAVLEDLVPKELCDVTMVVMPKQLYFDDVGQQENSCSALRKKEDTDLRDRNFTSMHTMENPENRKSSLESILSKEETSGKFEKTWRNSLEPHAEETDRMQGSENPTPGSSAPETTGYQHKRRKVDRVADVLSTSPTLQEVFIQLNVDRSPLTAPDQNMECQTAGGYGSSLKLPVLEGNDAIQSNVDKSPHNATNQNMENDTAGGNASSLIQPVHEEDVMKPNSDRSPYTATDQNMECHTTGGCDTSLNPSVPEEEHVVLSIFDEIPVTGIDQNIESITAGGYETSPNLLVPEEEHISRSTVDGLLFTATDQNMECITTGRYEASPKLQVREEEGIAQSNAGRNSFTVTYQDMECYHAGGHEDSSKLPLPKEEIGKKESDRGAIATFTSVHEDPHSLFVSSSPKQTGDSQCSSSENAEWADLNSSLFDLKGQYTSEADTVIELGNSEFLTSSGKGLGKSKTCAVDEDFDGSACSLQRRAVALVGADQSKPEFEGFLLQNDEDSCFMEDGINFEELDLSKSVLERVSVLEELCKYACGNTPLPHFSTPYNLHKTYVHRSGLNGPKECLDLRCSLNDSFDGRSHSDSLPYSDSESTWNIKKTYKSPIGKFLDKITSNSGSSGKRASLNPELPCISEENENIDDVADAFQEGNELNGVADSVKREPLADISKNSDFPPISELEICTKDSIASVNTEFSFTSTNTMTKKALRSYKNNNKRLTNKGKENQIIAQGERARSRASKSVRNTYRTPELSVKNSLRKEGSSISQKEPNCTNIVSNISSFIPLVQQKQAPAIITGKREIKVKSLEAAEATRRLQEKIENVRKKKKEDLKLERAKQVQENRRQLELQQKRKEEEQMKKEAEMAAIKRQREEEERKEKERKRKRIEEKKQQQEHEEKLRARKDERETKCQTTDETEHWRNRSKYDTGKERKLEKETRDEPKASTNHALKQSIVRENSVASSSHDSKLLSNTNSDKQDENLFMKMSEEPSYDMSPYKCSDDEDEEDDDVPKSKFIPSWASKKCLAAAVSLQQNLNPEAIFPLESSYRISEVLLPRRLQLR